MLNDAMLCIDDVFWASILTDLGAGISGHGIRFAAPDKKVSIPELAMHVENIKSNRIREMGVEKLSGAEQRLAIMLPATARELKSRMGYAESTATHTIETLIYNIRKKMGQEFITLDGGVYKLK